MTSIAKKSLLWGVGSFLVLVLIIVLRFGAAEWVSVGTREDVQSMFDERRIPSADESSSIVSRLAWAERLSPWDNTAVLVDQARFSLLHAAQVGLSVEERREILRAGHADTLDAIRSNPASPYRWTMLLLIKRDLGEFDEEFRHALRRATELGPWEPSLLLIQADVGLSALDKMPVEEQEIILQVLERGLKRQEKAINGVLRAHMSPCTEGKGCQ